MCAARVRSRASRGIASDSKSLGWSTLNATERRSFFACCIMPSAEPPLISCAIWLALELAAL